MLRKIIYDILRNYTWFGQLIYFRRYKAHYSYPIPKNASIIYAANHQNSFLDAIALIGAQSSRPTWLTRANMFETAVARFILHAFYMLPIYRKRDGIRSVNKNQEIIKECIRLLNEEKQPIGIFPEGNHNLKYRLRPLQKGITRIAFEAAEESRQKNQLIIVPCGITYSDHTRFRSDLLINFGKPIPVEKFYKEWKELPTETTKKLLEEIKANMNEVMINIKSAEDYDQIFTTWQKNKSYHPDLHHQFLQDKEIIEQIENGSFEEKPKTKFPFRDFLYKVLGFPLYLLGMINNLVIWGVSTLIVKKLVTDIHFVTPVRYGAGLVLVPLVYLIQGLIINLFVPYFWWTLIYLFMIFILGLFSADYHNRVFRTSGSGEK